MESVISTQRPDSDTVPEATEMWCIRTVPKSKGGVGSLEFNLEWTVLWFTALASGAVVGLILLNNAIGTINLPMSYLWPYVPGAIMGAFRFVTSQSPARIPFISLICLVFAGLIWVQPTEVAQGFTFILVLLFSMSVSLNFNSRFRWFFGAKWFTFGAFLSSLILYADFVASPMDRLGSIEVDGNRVLDPNYVGVFYSVAIIVALTVGWNGAHEVPNRRSLASLLAIWFGLIVLLSGSRGSLLTAVSAIIVFFIWGRVRWKWLGVGLGAMIALASIAITWAINGQPEILERFSIEEFGSFGHRTPIWTAAVEQMNSWSPLRMLVGEGTGSAPYAIGSRDPDLAHLLYITESLYAPNGVPRVSGHSTYIEWFISFGVMGSFLGGLLLANASLRSVGTDKGSAGASALAFLAVFVITSITLPAFRMSEITVVCSAIALGYIYMIPSDRSDFITRKLPSQQRLGIDTE